MASIHGLSNNQIKSLYRSKIEVYLEGEDDLSIYKYYWFRQYIDKIDFKLAQEGVAPFPGCHGVESNVLLQRQVGVKAFGFVDRDSISDLSHSNEIDNARYVLENHKRNQFVYRTVRWELENYLIDPDILEQERVNEKGRGQGKRAVEEVAAELLVHCEVLKVHAAANIVLHQARRKKIEDGFAINIRERGQYESEILAKYLTEPERESYFQWLSKIEAFDLPGDTAENRLDAVIRRVHGKALFMRFFYDYKIKSEKRFSVADKLCAKVPSELTEKIKYWVSEDT